jgi:hypothetical protein
VEYLKGSLGLATVLQKKGGVEKNLGGICSIRLMMQLFFRINILHLKKPEQALAF